MNGLRRSRSSSQPLDTVPYTTSEVRVASRQHVDDSFQGSDEQIEKKEDLSLTAKLSLLRPLVYIHGSIDDGA